MGLCNYVENPNCTQADERGYELGLSIPFFILVRKSQVYNYDWGCSSGGESRHHRFNPESRMMVQKRFDIAGLSLRPQCSRSRLIPQQWRRWKRGQCASVPHVRRMFRLRPTITKCYGNRYYHTRAAAGAETPTYARETNNAL